MFIMPILCNRRQILSQQHLKDKRKKRYQYMVLFKDGVVYLLTLCKHTVLNLCETNLTS